MLFNSSDDPDELADLSAEVSAVSEKNKLGSSLAAFFKEEGYNEALGTNGELSRRTNEPIPLVRYQRKMYMK